MSPKTVPTTARHTQDVGTRLGGLYPQAAKMIPPDGAATTNPPVR